MGRWIRHHRLFLGLDWQGGFSWICCSFKWVAWSWTHEWWKLWWKEVVRFHSPEFRVGQPLAEMVQDFPLSFSCMGKPKVTLLVNEFQVLIVDCLPFCSSDTTECEEKSSTPTAVSKDPCGILNFEILFPSDLSKITYRFGESPHRSLVAWGLSRNCRQPRLSLAEMIRYREIFEEFCL